MGQGEGRNLFEFFPERVSSRLANAVSVSIAWQRCRGPRCNSRASTGASARPVSPVRPASLTGAQGKGHQLQLSDSTHRATADVSIANGS